MDDNEAVIEKMSTEKVVKSLWELVRLCKYQERPFRYQLSLKRAIRAIENTEGNDPEKITKECPACGVPTGTSHKSICSAGHGVFGFKNAPSRHGCAGHEEWRTQSK